MATVREPKYKLGQKLHTVSLTDLRHIEFTVAGIDIAIRQDETRIEYKEKDGYRSYDEQRCFLSEQELMNHITAK